MTLGKAIKRLRRAAGLTQRDLATKLQVNSTYISHLEADRRDPSIALLRKLGSTLNVPPGLLIGITLWSELPEPQRSIYEGIIERLLELGLRSQLALPINETNPN
jgi:transcriptional regulator with XRE-family HTH domain